MKSIFTIHRKLFVQLSDGSYVSYQNLGMKTTGNAGGSIGAGNTTNVQGTLGNAKATTSTLDWKNMTSDQREARKAELYAKKKTISDNAANQVNQNATADAIRQNEKKLNGLYQDKLSNPNTTIEDKKKILNQNTREAKNIVKQNGPAKVTGTNAFMNNTQFNSNRLTPKSSMGWGKKAMIGTGIAAGLYGGYKLLGGGNKKED